MKPLRLVFMGTPDFSVPVLSALQESGHEVLAVYTQPPKQAGRGHKYSPSPVQKYAESRDIEVRTPQRLVGGEVNEAFEMLEADAAIVTAYGLILPISMLLAPRLGCLNLHASLLPRWRGAAPIQRALMAGDRETGLTVMQMDKGLDTGPILLSQTVPVGEGATAGELHNELSHRGSLLMLRALAGIVEGDLIACAQPSEGITYANKLEPRDERIDWHRSARDIECQIRALLPQPGAWFLCQGERIKIAAATVIQGPEDTPGLVLDDNLLVACGGGAIRLHTLQRAGRKPLAAQDFLRGFAIPEGTRL